MILDGINDGIFTMHSNGLSFDEGSIVLKTFEDNLQINEFIYDFDREMVSIVYNPPAVDASFQLEVSGDYTGAVNQRFGFGLYLEQYQDKDQNTR